MPRLSSRLGMVSMCLLAACSSTPRSGSTAGPRSPVRAASVTATEAETHAPPPNRIATETLEPERIVIALEDLPAPSTERVSRRPEVVPPPEDATLRVPAGFEVNVFADDIASARWLAVTPSGEILVAQSRENRITLLADRDGDGAAEVREVFADEGRGDPLDVPFGMAFAGDRFYLGNQDEVRRFPYAPGQQRLEGQGERITSLPGGGYNQHWTRNVVVSPDGARLFVSIGSESNDDIEALPRASVQVMALDGSERRTFAHGLRNPVGLAFHPRTGALWASVNERDGLGDDLVPDYLARIEDGAFYGWPWVYLAPHLRDPNRGNRAAPPEAARTRTPEVLFQAHSAALGLAFAGDGAGRTFPERYRRGAFVAFRGSWNRARGTGYQISFVPFDAEGRPEGGYEPFVTGFLLDPTVPRTWGRPVGVVFAPDGSLLFTEEMNGRVYRVQFVGTRG